MTQAHIKSRLFLHGNGVGNVMNSKMLKDGEVLSFQRYHLYKRDNSSITSLQQIHWKSFWFLLHRGYGKCT